MMLFVLLLLGFIHEDADSLIVDNDTLAICGTHQYNIMIELRNSGMLQVRQWSGAADSFGVLELEAPVIIIRNASVIIGSNNGPYGGYMNSHPWGYGTGGGSAGGVSGGAGGGGAYGGDGGIGGDNYGGAGGTAYGSSTDTLVEYGSGGGAGRLSAIDGAGGNGGAKIYLKADSIAVTQSQIESNGQDAVYASVEAGGGGSGGGIMLFADYIMFTDAGLYANGGDGGDAAYGGGGGAGGGRVKIFYESLFDTSSLAISVTGGAPGTGTYGNPQAGAIGSWYIAYAVDIAEYGTTQRTVFAVHPNPVTSKAVLSCSDYPAHVSVYDAVGRLVKYWEITNDLTVLDFSHINRGVYFLTSSETVNVVRKIVVLK